MRRLGSAAINQKSPLRAQASGEKQKPDEKCTEREMLLRGAPLHTDTARHGTARHAGLRHTHLAVLRVDVLTEPLHDRPVDEQAPHDHDHFQHLPQGHLSEHACANMNTYT